MHDSGLYNKLKEELFCNKANYKQYSDYNFLKRQHSLKLKNRYGSPPPPPPPGNNLGPGMDGGGLGNQFQFQSVVDGGEYTVLSRNISKQASKIIPKVFKQARRVFRNSNTVICFQEVPKWGCEDWRSCSGFSLQGFPNSDCCIAIPAGWVPHIRSRSFGHYWCGVLCFSMLIISGHNIPWGLHRTLSMLGEIHK